VFPNIDPNLVDPVTKSTLDVIVCTTNVCAVNVPATVNAFANEAVCAETAFDADTAKATNDAVCAFATNDAVDANNTGAEPDICPEVLMVANIVEPLINEMAPASDTLIAFCK
jgi:hypothetical protein